MGSKRRVQLGRGVCYVQAFSFVSKSQARLVTGQTDSAMVHRGAAILEVIGEILKSIVDGLIRKRLGGACGDEALDGRMMAKLW